MRDQNFILRGPHEENDIPSDVTLGKYFIDCLRKRHKDEIININPVTGETLTCGKLLEHSIQLVTVLKSFEIRKGDVISISSENSIEYCIPLLAAFFMGVTVNLLNSSYAVGEIRHALNIAKPKLVICSEETFENVHRAIQDYQSVETLLIMGSAPKVNNCANVWCLYSLLRNTRVDIEEFQPDDFDSSKQGALILMSSGTTGLPKGVMITHENLKIPICAIGDVRYGGMSGNHTAIAILPFFFIFGILLQFSALIHPLKLVVLSKFVPSVFFQSIQVYGVTKLQIAPPLLLVIAKSPLVKDYNLSSVADILCGGAPLGYDMEDEAAKSVGNVTVRQAYGLSETSGPCMYLSQIANKPGSIGALIPKLEAKVVDTTSGDTVGPYKHGELCFKGSTVFTGYLGVETTKDFDEDGFFHSGDVGYFDDDLHFFVVGRTKELIKYKGFQVAPAELENLILQHPNVKDCGVIGIPDDRAGEVALALVVRRENVNVNEEEIMKYVAEKISREKHLHGGVVFVNEIPRNPSGKIVRRILHDVYNNSLIL